MNTNWHELFSEYEKKIFKLNIANIKSKNLFF